MKVIEDMSYLEGSGDQGEEVPAQSKLGTFMGELAINSQDVFPAELEVSDSDLDPRTRTPLGSGNYDSD